MRDFVTAIGFLLLISLAVMYQNCGTGFKTSSLVNSSSQCNAQKAQKVLSADTINSDQFCFENGLYRCQKKVFSPNVTNQLHTIRECFKDGSSYDVCMDISEYLFSTKELIKSEPTSAFEEGADYNRTEYHCYIYESEFSQTPLSHGIGTTIDEAVQSLVTNCKNKEVRL